MLCISVAILLIASCTAAASDGGWRKLPSNIYIQTRRRLNLSSLFGSATNASPYDRIAGHPVFSVTTPWGSPYLNMETLSENDEVVQMDDTEEGSSSSSSKKKPSGYDDSSEYRTVALYFMDPDDALGVQSEMKQMENMEQADLRITSSSLAKAVRQASNLGHGLLTGQPPDPLTGDLDERNGALRYKIVPPKRQLYYAARCIGRERVGLFGSEAVEDAQAAVIGNPALEQLNLERRRQKREPKIAKKKGRTPKTEMQARNAHMDGYSGIPVFYCPEMSRRKLPWIKRLMTGTQYEIPLFFSYEDMMTTWQRMRMQNKKQSIQETPSNVEVFNLWDVLTSMDRDACDKKQKTSFKDSALKPFRERFSSQPPDLEHITFVPPSRSVQYKEAISGRGNGKARLRPMR